jgi:hypothetical protein
MIPALKLASPTTKEEADVMALKLFCLFSFILIGSRLGCFKEPQRERRKSLAAPCGSG